VSTHNLKSALKNPIFDLVAEAAKQTNL